MRDPAARVAWLAAIHSPQARAKRRESNLNNRAPRRAPIPYVRRDGESITVRSQWELAFAALLDARSLKWKYEPMTFSIGDSLYTPDFFVESPLGDCYVELHRMKQVRPGDERKVAKIIRATMDIPHKTGAPLVVIEETSMRDIRRESARAVLPSGDKGNPRRDHGQPPAKVDR